MSTNMNAARATLVHVVLLAAVIASIASSPASFSGDDDDDGAGGPQHCAQSPTTCRCSNQPFTLRADEASVDNCNDTAPGSACCFDVDSSGETTSCECATYACNPSDNDCNCFWMTDGAPPSAIAPSECTDRSAAGVPFPLPGICCDSGEFCDCYGAESSTSTETCFNGAQRDSCAGPSEVRDCSFFGSNNTVGQAPASTCAGLTWKAP
jgi:hypothetical protein